MTSNFWVKMDTAHDLSKIEIKTIIEALQFQMVESESLNDFNDKVNEEVGFKLYQLLNK